MLTIRVDKKLMDACIDRYQLSPTIPEDAASLDHRKFDCCGKAMVAMRLDKSPNTGGGIMSPNDRCLFYGCNDCNTFVYDEDELNNYANKRTNLKDFVSYKLGIG
jgi:hypothetical protein